MAAFRTAISISTISDRGKSAWDWSDDDHYAGSLRAPSRLAPNFPRRMRQQKNLITWINRFLLVQDVNAMLGGSFVGSVALSGVA